MILTGSPRPTFAETNAWLLDGQSSRSNTTTSGTPGNNKKKRNAEFAGSYTIADNSNAFVVNDGDDDGGGNDNSGTIAAGEFSFGKRENGSDDASSAGVNTSFVRRHTFPADAGTGVASSTNNNNNALGPMVGRAVVDAVSTSDGVGLQSSRAKLLQGTIDRPDWDQGRWTDGECVFGELVSRCGLDSFENTAGGGEVGGRGRHTTSDDVVEVGGDVVVPATAAAGSRLRKTTNLSAHLVTVPAMARARVPGSSASLGAGGTTLGYDALPGMGEETIEEIARGVLRCLKRKGSPPASGVYLVIPPDRACEGGGMDDDDEAEGQGTRTPRMKLISSLLVEALRKLERHNDMIGAPRLMADARFEFVPVLD